MQMIIKAIMSFIFVLGFTNGTFELYKTIRKEVLTKVSKGSPRLSNFTQKMTGQKNAW